MDQRPRTAVSDGTPRGREIDQNSINRPRHSTSKSSAQNARASSMARPWQDEMEVTTLNTNRHRNWGLDLSTLPKNFMRQILGLNPFRTSYFSLFRPLKSWKSRLILACAILFAVAAGIPLPLIGLLFGKIINDFPPPEEELLTRLGQLIGVAVAYFIFTWIWSVCWGVVGERISRGLREALVHRAVGMDMAYFDVSSPDITSILTGDTQTIQIGTSEKVGLFIQSISYFVSAFTVGFILNAQLTGIMFGAVIPPMLIVVMGGTTAVSRLSKQASKLSEKASQIAESAIDAVQVVQAFGADKILCDQHLAILSRATRVGFKKGIAGACMLGCVYCLAYAANALAFWKGSQLVEGGGAGTVYAVVFLILDASFVVGQFGPFIQSLSLAAAAGGKVIELIDRPSPSIDVYSDEGIQLSENNAQQDICFENMTFVYPARPTVRVLDDVDLRFRAGTTTGIVGLSGSGKSTIASLILRLYDATSGCINLGDTDLREYNLRSLRSRIALVDQDPVLFTGTILENISHGILNRSNLSDRQILDKCIQAATDANADFVSQLSHGVHTKVGGAGGTQLSGGQKQRICLARALVRNPSILILDEPTSALDATSETLILEALRRVSSRGCTVITIAHRLATIKDADNIMVMGHGMLLEEGSHEQLVQGNGPYSQLVEAQKLVFETQALLGNDSPERLSVSYADQHYGIKTGIQNTSSDASSGETVKDPKTGSQPDLTTINLIRRCFGISKPERLYIAVGVLASMASGALIIGEAAIFGNLVSILNKDRGLSNYSDRVDFFCLMFFVVALIALVAYTISGCAFGLVSEHLVRRTRDMSLRTILQQDMAWFSKTGHATHELMATVSTDSTHLSGLSGVILGTLFSVSSSIFGGIILAHAVAWKIAIVLLAAVPVMIAAGFMRLRVLSKFEQRHETAYNDAAALASEACRAIRTVAAFGREEDVLEQYKAALRKPYRQSFRFIVLGNLILAFSLAITYFVYALAYWWGAKQVREGAYNQQEFFTVLPALLFSAQAAGQMFSLAPEVTRAKAAAKSVFSLHDQKPTIMTPSKDRFSPSDSSEKDLKRLSTEFPSASQPHITFDSVNLAYASRPDHYVLKDLSFDINRGEFIGIVGASGAGKSSIISLLERFYDPVSGSISFNGVDIQDVPVALYRTSLALVPQEPDLFSGTISFNIGLGARPGYTVSQDDIEETCRLLNIHDFIMSLPQGYQTDCGQNGSQVSGGQKQRIAIARALVRDPEILLLDEATASLDAHSDSEVQDAVAVAKEKGRTTIVVAHRLSSVQKADRILVFDQGRLVEQGRHEELIANGKIYSAMAKAHDMA